jgi:hypothetical protein
MVVDERRGQPLADARGEIVGEFRRHQRVHSLLAERPLGIDRHVVGEAKDARGGCEDGVEQRHSLSPWREGRGEGPVLDSYRSQSISITTASFDSPARRSNVAMPVGGIDGRHTPRIPSRAGALAERLADAELPWAPCDRARGKARGAAAARHLLDGRIGRGIGALARGGKMRDHRGEQREDTDGELAAEAVEDACAADLRREGGGEMRGVERGERRIGDGAGGMRDGADSPAARAARARSISPSPPRRPRRRRTR